MSYDPVVMFTNARNAYRRSRLSLPAMMIMHARTKRPLFRPGQLVPFTTWGDVMTFYSSFMAYTDPDQKQCLEVLKKAGISANEAAAKCLMGKGPNNFVHTDDFNRAKAEWAAVSPFKKASSLADAFAKSGQVYPWNEEFWGYGSEYAKARSAAGEVEFPFDMAVESIGWAVKNLPQTLKDAANALPKPPSLWSIAEVIKWASIGGGLFMLYWYVLRPKKA